MCILGMLSIGSTKSIKTKLNRDQEKGKYKICIVATLAIASTKSIQCSIGIKRKGRYKMFIAGTLMISVPYRSQGQIHDV